VPATRQQRTRAGRPLKPLITREAAVAAAMAVIDRDGLEALSVQSVARAMKVSAPSLYYHFKDKDELLQLVARELLRQIGKSTSPEASWEERMIGLSVATLRVILEHANAAPLMLRFFPRSLMLSAYENSLVDTPYPVEHQMVVVEAIEKLTYGTALFAAAAETYHLPAMPAFDVERYPRLAKALQAGPQDQLAMFEESLRALLDGFKTRYG
jgi:AcrR family transcriptional regulator